MTESTFFMRVTSHCMRKIVCWSIGFGKGRKDRLCGVAVTTDEDDMCVALGVASELSLTFRRQI